MPIDLAGMGIAEPMTLWPNLFVSDERAQARLADRRDAFFAQNPELRLRNGGAKFVRETIRPGKARDKDAEDRV